MEKKVNLVKSANHTLHFAGDKTEINIVYISCLVWPTVIDLVRFQPKGNFTLTDRWPGRDVPIEIIPRNSEVVHKPCFKL